MIYLLKYRDIALLKFTFHAKPLEGLSVEILKTYAAQRAHFPLDLKADNRSLLAWLKRRVIPKNRAFVHNFLARLGLGVHDTEGIIRICKGLSLNDCYWVVEENFTGTFAAYNLYDNRFDHALALIAYTGYGDSRHRDFVSSPELTTNGMLAKAWRRFKDGRTVLYKAGSTGAANAGKEPYSEFYACQVAQAMGLEAVQYDLSYWKKHLCSTCELFTSQTVSYLPTGNLVTEGGWPAVMQFYRQLGEKYYQNLLDMLIFDAVICNQDRHFGNFGLLFDSDSREIVSTAPLFDHGLSLFHQAMAEDLQNIDAYAQSLAMASGQDFLWFAREIITPHQKEKLRRLVNFTFKPHSSYNLPAKRLKIIARFIQSRTQVLLGMKSKHSVG